MLPKHCVPLVEGDCSRSVLLWFICRFWSKVSPFLCKLKRFVVIWSTLCVQPNVKHFAVGKLCSWSVLLKLCCWKLEMKAGFRGREREKCPTLFCHFPGAPLWGTAQEAGDKDTLLSLPAQCRGLMCISLCLTDVTTPLATLIPPVNWSLFTRRCWEWSAPSTRSSKHGTAQRTGKPECSSPFSWTFLSFFFCIINCFFSLISTAQPDSQPPDLWGLQESFFHNTFPSRMRM